MSRWRRLELEKGCVRPGPLGGDRRSGRIEAQADLVFGLVAETPDITGTAVALARRGHAFGYGTLQRFFVRHRVTRKKTRTPASRTAPTS